MTTPFETEVESHVRTLLKASADLARVAAFARGILFLVPAEWYPLVEIVVDDLGEEQDQTGVHGYSYGGAIYVSDQYPDHPALADREINVESQDQVKALARAIVLILKANPTLGDLVSADGKERVWRVDVSVPKYAIAPSRGRQDNLESQAAVEFQAHSQRQTW
jgi:hypothetical protein